ncbi:MAG: UDP-N-acetylglucosamine 1-carboxyvinyltransferase [bacterium]|nr:UDP-N-acetylglucosamine 1-carboxyvinyltransferase [bacterium]
MYPDPLFSITGPSTIHGSIAVAGAKNEALKLFAAALLADAPVTVRRTPDIEDVRRMVEMVRALGATVTGGPHEYTIDAASLAVAELPEALMGKLRAGLVLIGPLLHRFGKTVVSLPGGDVIGRRPIDFFIDGFRAFGVTVDEQPNAVRFTIVPSRIGASHYTFPFVSVTGTEALLLYAVRAPGMTTLENVAMEPEVVALGEFLNACGARIDGLGTPTLRIDGVDRLAGGIVTCIPDRIEAVTFAAFVATCGGSLEITDCDPAHLRVPIAYLRAMGAVIEEGTTSLRVTVDGPLRSVSFRTHEYPGMATDFQPPLTVALTQASGVALVHETIYEGRLFYVDRLNRMGANIILCDPHRCVVAGPQRLYAAVLGSPDIRAGIALVIAAAAAEGTSTIHNVYQVDRGFERIEARLRAIGVRIERREGGTQS